MVITNKLLIGVGHMLSVHMQKDVTIIKPLSNNRSLVYSLKYNELENALKNQNEITVNYCYGKRKIRTKRLIDLGYKLKETIFYNNTELWGSIKEVWSR